MDYTAIEWRSVALLVIDVQNDFVDGASPVAGTAEVLPALTDLVEVFRAASRPVVHVVRLYEPGGSDVDPVRRAMIEAGSRVVAPGSTGARIPAPLTLGRVVDLDTALLLTGRLQELSDQEAIAYKPRWSAFHRTGVLAWLTARGITSVLVAGCNLPNCPRATLFDASERDLRAAIVTDAVSQATGERLHDLTLIGINLLTVDDVRRQLGPARRTTCPVHG